MTTRKASPKKKAESKEAGPRAVRPQIPATYGISKDKKNLLPWSHVTERMTLARHYWISTVSPSGRPYATPIDGLWIDGKLYFGGSPETQWNRNLKANPGVCLHLESGTDVVILHGEAKESKGMDHAVAVQLANASVEKYGYSPPLEGYEKGEGVMIFRPRIVVAWSQFPKDATRWELEP